VYQRRSDPVVSRVSLLFADRIELGSVFNADFSPAAHGMESPN